MAIEPNPELIVSARRMNGTQPFPRPADDGTYEILVPLAGHSQPLILPYSFSSEEDATRWILSPKGSKRLEKARIFRE